MRIPDVAHVALVALVALVVAACTPPAAPPVAVAAPAPPPVSFVVAAPPVAPSPASTTTTAPAQAKLAPTASPQPAPKPAAKPALEAPSKEHLLEDLFAQGGAALKTVVRAPETYRFQVLYGTIEGGRLTRHGFRVDAEYFYPASSMKMPITLAAYDRLAVLRGAQPALTRDATMRIHPATSAGDPYTTTLARETWRALIVSDNASANRILGVVGHRETNETLWSLGLASARVRAGFATGGEIDPAELSPLVEFTAPSGTGELPARKSTLVLPPNDAKGLAVGKAVMVDGRRVEGPMSFAEKNAIRITDLQDTLIRLVRPDLLPKGSVPDTATADDRAYVRQALGTLPSESGIAGYDRNVVADYQIVPFLRGIERVRARGKFTIESKVGQAYGFLVSNAYITDKETGRSFFLTAAVYANPDEVLNSDNYAYESVSFPAMADLAELLCRHAFAP